MRKVVTVVAVLLVLGALGGGFYYIGPPAEERARRMDNHRESDMQRLRLAADLYWTRNQRLPPTLDELDKEAGTRVYSNDPESGEPYEYTIASESSYQLCGVFARESEVRGDFWSHAAGRHCYAITPREIKP